MCVCVTQPFNLFFPHNFSFFTGQIFLSKYLKSCVDIMWQVGFLDSFKLMTYWDKWHDMFWMSFGFRRVRVYLSHCSGVYHAPVLRFHVILVTTLCPPPPSPPLPSSCKMISHGTADTVSLFPLFFLPRPTGHGGSRCRNAPREPRWKRGHAERWHSAAGLPPGLIRLYRFTEGSDAMRFPTGPHWLHAVSKPVVKRG